MRARCAAALQCAGADSASHTIQITAIASEKRTSSHRGGATLNRRSPLAAERHVLPNT